MNSDKQLDSLLKGMAELISKAVEIRTKYVKSPDKKHYEASNGPERITRDYSEQTLRFSRGKSEGPLSDGNYGPGYYNDEKITKECEAKKAEPSINDDLSVIFTQLDNMDYVFNALTEKLRPVIKPIPESGINGCDPGPRLPNSPVSEQLKNISASIETLTVRIRFLTKSIDL